MPNNKSLEPGLNRFESDSQKIVRKHLQDKDHVISEEELHNVRVGITPTQNESPLDEIMDAIGSEPKKASKEKPADHPVTPWDTTEH